MNPALPTYGSTITAAMRLACLRNSSATAVASLNGAVNVRLANAAGTPGLSGNPGRVRVPEDQGAPRADVVDILPAVDIDETGAVPPRDKKRRPADCPERPYG